MEGKAPGAVTKVLSRLREGSEDARAELISLVYQELRGLAYRQMGRVPARDTLQPTALVHEAYLRLLDRDNPSWEDRRHFFAAAARAMRDIVVEQARRHASRKRGGDRVRVPLDDAVIQTSARADDLIALDEALRAFESVDAECFQVVMLRFFGGLTVEETGQALAISPRSVKRHWQYARAWLNRALGVPEE